MEETLLLCKFIFLGIIQGFTEPLPVSSSAHLVIFRELFHVSIEGLSFEILVHFASFIAIILVYRHHIFQMIQVCFHYIFNHQPKYKTEFNLLKALFIATVPTAVLGLIAKDFIEARFVQLHTIGYSLLLTSLSLWLIRKKEGFKNDGEIRWVDAVIIGLVQSIALVPGISRSGATIVAALFLGLSRETATRFSFLLYLPVSFGSFVFSAVDMVSDQILFTLWIPYMLAFISALFASYIALKLFIQMIQKGLLNYFAMYCLCLGIALLYLF